MTEKIVSHPQYADWVNDYCSAHPDAFVRDSAKMIDYCFQLDKELPEKYGWRFSDEESFRKQINGLKSSKEHNKVYWTDQARNVEAYSTMTFWRGIELLKPAIRSLNANEVTTSAVLARSLLELSSSFITNANILEKTFREIKFRNGATTVSHEVEAMVVKMIWGTRIGDPAPHLKQTSILTIIQKLSKNPHAKNLLPTYEYLCDVAHPNFIGNTRFWSHIEKVHPDGSQQRVISRSADKECTQEIIEKILWSLGWSAAVLRNGFEITREAILQLLQKLETTKTSPT